MTNMERNIENLIKSQTACRTKDSSWI